MSESKDAYALAGVDIAAGNAAVAQYREVLGRWQHPDQLDAIGGFGGLFAMPGDAARALVASTDGVGTKILIAAELQRYDGVGRDLVNHCVNDILVVNASPLFFLDYYAVGKLDPEIAAAVVRGCANACRAHGCALLGGETAEMPGLYAPGHFDLAGTIVGVVDRAAVPNPASVEPGDAVIGLPAVGLHTNGYSLARALIPHEQWLQPFGDATYADALLAEHPSYYDAVRAIQKVASVKVMAHITGGGLLENLPRTLRPGVKAVLEQSRWSVPAIQQVLVDRGGLTHEERYRTLNMGIGYTLVVPVEDAARAVAAAPGATTIGWIEARTGEEAQVTIHPARSTD
ncbi:MAG: phosphoribosylformylglycinamidine cyclo-ligase [Candidatus Eremiobacteraeota bacterium]|nr:phosphoribosylformylglycinamidine cyclo-ligase [Candidatus Eremiobacteraeota bacterium]NNM91727.1 phosphoribosylformylglycinamidine cyclo-ligase [Candidatus Eremiobacteraeota bacterium]